MHASLAAAPECLAQFSGPKTQSLGVAAERADARLGDGGRQLYRVDDGIGKEVR